MISGLKYIDNYLSLEQEAELISKIDFSDWSNDLKRRTQHYGYKYDYTLKKITPSSYIGEIPDWLKSSGELLVNQKYFEELPDQVIVNEYQPGQGIARHVDCTTCFDHTIASISLNSACLMVFENFRTKEVKQLYLQPRSLLLLSGEARYDWMHSIAAQKSDTVGYDIFPRERRVSITFRNVLLYKE
jgi:alkylated DNA repair dioxygenase AlkB